MAAITPKVWTFTQLGGSGSGVPMQLAGWSAPFGRPRNGTIVNAGVKLRQNTIYYPGSVEPTVHVFGIEPKPWELKGRFMDSALGTSGAAKLLRRAWYDFVAQGQVVRAQWGDILSYRGVIEDIDLNFESEAEIAWALRMIVLADESAQKAVGLDAPPRTPLDLTSAMRAPYSGLTSFPPPSCINIVNLLPILQDALSVSISNLTSAFSELAAVAESISDFQTALASDLSKMGSALQATRTAIINLQLTNDQLVDQAIAIAQPTPSAPLSLFTGQQMIALTAGKADADAQAANFQALLNDMQNSLDKANRGSIAKATQAVQNDTWEAMGSRLLGGPDAGRSIRDMNGARHGARPQSGARYSIPRQ